MITTLAPVMLDHLTANGSSSIRVVAAPIWDIGAELKNKGITFAVWLLMGGTALVAAFEYLVVHNKTAALKTVVIGVVLMGVVGSLPSLGVVSKDTVGGLTHSGTR